MGDKDKKTQLGNGKPSKSSRRMAGSEIVVTLEKLAQKIKKCQSREKDLKRLAEDRAADSLDLARQLRALERQFADLLGQVRELVEGQRNLEQGREQERVATAEMRASLDRYAERLDADAQQVAEIGSGAQRLELLGQQVSERADSLERRILSVEGVLDQKYAALLGQIHELAEGQRNLEQGQQLERAAMAELRESLDLYAGRLDADAQKFAEVGSKAQRVELVGQQVSRKAETLEQRIRTVERALSQYEERLQACVALPAQALEGTRPVRQGEQQAESGSGGGSNVVVFKKQHSGESGGDGDTSALDRDMLARLKSRLDSVEDVAEGVKRQVERSSQSVQALKAGQERLAARDEQLRQLIEQEVEGLSSMGEATWADLERQVAHDLKRDAVVDDLRLAAKRAAKQIGLLTIRLGTLEAARAELKQIAGHHQRELQDLQLQARVETEQGRILAGKIQTLDAAWQGLADSTEWQASQLSELGQETRRLGGEAEALSARTDGLVARLDETAGPAQGLEQRLEEVKSDSARLAKQHQQLQEASRRLATAHRRLSVGAAVLLLLLIGAVSAFWAYRPQADLSESRDGQIAALQQAVDRYAERVAEKLRLRNMI